MSTLEKVNPEQSIVEYPSLETNIEQYDLTMFDGNVIIAKLFLTNDGDWVCYHDDAYQTLDVTDTEDAKLEFLEYVKERLEDEVDFLNKAIRGIEDILKLQEGE